MDDADDDGSLAAGTAPAWRAVMLGERERAEVQGLFAQVFGGTMSDALWHWKYGDGHGAATGVRDADGALLAHYGGTARTLSVGGTRVGAVQLGDVMVRADVRGILSRRGPFAMAARCFLEAHVGDGARWAQGFGFPNERAARLGERLGLYQRLGEVIELAWSGAGAPPVPWRATRTEALDPRDPRTPARLDALWRRLQRDVPGLVLPVRDAAWWRHRFFAHPQPGRYRAWWVRSRWSRRLLGAVVLRPGAAAGDDWEWMDAVGGWRDAGRVLAAARRLAAQHGAPRLLGWFSAPLAAR